MDKPARIKKSQVMTLDIQDLAFGGRGIAKVEGFTIFVDQTVPGDRVEARIIRKKRSFAEARVLALLAPSSLRITPPCSYSGHCGGCKWQFMDYAHQLDFKRRHVAESLTHIGLIHDVPVHPVIASDLAFGYRNKMEFSCAARRWLLPEEMGREDIDAGFAIGLHVPGTFHKVLDIEACLLQPDMGNAILEHVRAYIRNSGQPIYGLRSHEGFWRFVVLRHSRAHDQWMVNIVTSRENENELRPLAQSLTTRFDRVVSVVNNITARKSGVAVGDQEILLAGAPFITDCIGRFEFEISANSFFQTNTAQADRLYETVRQFAGLTGSEQVIDLYCGTGTIGLFLADAARDVIGLEINAAAVADARQNCRRNGIANCRFVQGDIRDLLTQTTTDDPVMIIDPPRAGMHPDVVGQILNLAPKRIVYVSCNPATLARDLGMMKEGYRVLEVQPVDMFPHTYHIEAVARLEKIES